MASVIVKPYWPGPMADRVDVVAPLLHKNWKGGRPPWMEGRMAPFAQTPQVAWCTESFTTGAEYGPLASYS